MSNKFGTKHLGKLLAATLLVGGTLAAGCGSVSNNDQGTSFLGIGYFADTAGSTGLSGANVLLGSDVSQISGVQGIAGGSNVPIQSDGSQFAVVMGVENRLATQFLRVVRIDCSYDIPGASITIPDDSYNVSLVIKATGDALDDPSQPTINGTAGYIQYNILSTDLFSYLNVNRNSLPALPFRMTATCHAVGVSQAGDVFEANELVFPITMVEAASCCTGGTGGAGEDPGLNGGNEGGTGNGGGITFDDGTGVPDGEAAPASTPTVQ